jgi:hypothetical protein
MMMKMLDAGGLSPFTDYVRAADADNPKGYYEFERVKKLPQGDQEWVKDARGKAVKVISYFLEYLPSVYEYRVIFMWRRMAEILASQNQMLATNAKPVEEETDEKLAEIYHKHLDRVDAWMKKQTNMKVIYVDYNELLSDPDPYLTKIDRFLGLKLDKRRMGGVIDQSLYRHRS